jgi:predicted nucleotidyltransferase component of viral defense system
MIPRNFIQEWAKFVPWQEPRQVEQDLIITRALMEIYTNSELKPLLAFRGGTALNKLFFKPPSRYSEDIDLVQIRNAKIGDTIDLLRSVLDSWMGEPKRNYSEGRISLSYKVTSDDGFPIKLKIEINTNENFSVLGFKDYLFESDSSWTEPNVSITTYQIEELLGTKLRALYQRRKGRDLYDFYIAITTLSNLDFQKIIECFNHYMEAEGNKISRKNFIENMEIKLQNKEFLGDMIPLFPRDRNSFDPKEAYNLLFNNLVSLMR